MGSGTASALWAGASIDSHHVGSGQVSARSVNLSLRKCWYAGPRQARMAAAEV
jgi:hypothetical protein